MSLTLEDIKRELSSRTGIPTDLLTGETVEENISQAKALIAYKRDTENNRPKSPRESFSLWLQDQDGEEVEKDDPMRNISEYEEELRIASGGYPILRDGGNPFINGNNLDFRSPQEQFSEYIDKQLAFNPLKGDDGWIKIL